MPPSSSRDAIDEVKEWEGEKGEKSVVALVGEGTGVGANLGRAYRANRVEGIPGWEEGDRGAIV